MATDAAQKPFPRVEWIDDASARVLFAEGDVRTATVRHVQNHPRWGKCWILGDGLIWAIAQDHRGSRAWVAAPVHAVVGVGKLDVPFARACSERFANGAVFEWNP